MANEGTSLRGMDNNFLFLCVLQVTLANESIVLYMCEGKVLMDNKRPPHPPASHAWLASHAPHTASGQRRAATASMTASGHENGERDHATATATPWQAS